jgi:hypothetical protein
MPAFAMVMLGTKFIKLKNTVYSKAAKAIFLLVRKTNRFTNLF